MSILKRSLLLHVLFVIIASTGLVLGLLASLHTITKHGQDTKVPNVVGKKLNVAMAALKGFEIKIDSIYLPYKDPLEVIVQDPLPDNMVKTGRIVFLTVNKQSPPSITMPALVNMSFRNAILTLQSYRLIMGDTVFKPDIAAGAVLGQMFNGKPINAGSNIPVGSRIDLIIGAGLSDSIMSVPDLIGKSYAEARSILDAYGVLYNVVWDGSVTDSQTAIIYNQQPESKNELDFINNITPGDMVDIRIMQRPSAELLRMNQAGSRKFLDPNDSNAVVTYGPATNELPHSKEVDSLAKVAKPKQRRPKTIKEEVDDIINKPDDNNKAPETVQKIENYIGPKPDDADKQKKIIDKNKSVASSIGKDVKIDKIKTSKNTKSDKAKDTKSDKAKDTKGEKAKSTKLTEKQKTETPKKKKDAPVKAKNSNDFSEDFK